MQRKVPMLRRETRVPPGFAVENVARIGAAIWSQNQLFLITRKTLVLRSIRQGFRRRPRQRKPTRPYIEKKTTTRKSHSPDDGSGSRSGVCVMDLVCSRMKKTASMNRVRDP